MEKKYRAVISGYYGFRNAGDEAILTAMLNSFKSFLPDMEFTVLSGDPHYTSINHGVKSIHRFSFWQIVKAISNCHVFISGGGSLLQDSTSRKSLLYYLSLIALANLFNKPVMLYAQGIGPISSGFLKKLTGYVLRKVNCITVRDAESKKFLTDLGIDENKVKVTADVVFLLPKTQLQDGKILLNRFGVRQENPLIGVAVRSWGNDNYFGALVDALDALADRGKQILLIPFQYPFDMGCVRKLQRALRHPVKILDRECDTQEMLSIVGNLETVIGMRLHSLIFAAAMAVPFVALEYDPKVTGFVEMVGGCSAGSVTALTTKKILQAYEESGKVHVDLDKYKDLANENNELLKEIVEGSVVKC